MGFGAKWRSEGSGPSGGEVGPSGSEPVGSRQFPLAAQPEVMRAAEKDDQYASFIYDSCRDAFRHLFGQPFYPPLHSVTKLELHQKILNFTLPCVLR